MSDSAAPRVLAVFGGTGKTGGHVIRAALAAGWKVRALARKPEALPQLPGITAVQGDVLDPGAVDAVIGGADAVISAFGRRKDSPPALQTDGTRNIVAAMQEHGIRRLVSLTGGGVRAPQDQPKLIDNVIRTLLKTLQPEVLNDGSGHVEVLRGSDLDWVVVRGPVLTDDPRRGEYRIGWVGVNGSTKIPRADLADFMLSLASDDRYTHELPFVST